MCSGPRKPSPPPSPLTAPMDADPKNPSPAPAVALLLELAASDDVAALKRAVEIDGVDPDSSAPWYGRSVGPAVSPVRPMGTALRTPLSIAALYGSTNVLRYLLSLPSVNVNGRSTSDGATALHLAASGGAPNSLDAVNLLLSSSADVDALDSSNHRPGDVIAKHFSSSTARSLELILKSSSTSSSIPRLSSPDSPPKTPSEKKEYPPDLTLPDIKNGIYGTDEFRMYTFKVKPCSRAYSHDWTECPFVHPGENARRRDPRKYAYSCVPCPEFRKGSCRNGDNCEYAHGVFECWLHPAQYRTRLCKDEVGCNRRVCFFAHKPEELRSVNPTTASVGGLVLPSPRSSAAALGVSSLDMAAALMMMQQQQQQQQPGSPSASSGMGSATSWLSQSPAMSSSRLKSALSHRDFDLDLDLMGYQQKLLEEISGTASPRSNWTTAAAAPASRAADYNDLFGSLDQASMLSQLSMIPTAAAGSATQFQTSQSISQQLLSGFGSTLPSSPTVSAAASSFGLDHSMAKAILNSRASAFAQRSHSFIDRSAVARPPTSLSSGLSATGTSPPRALSNWGSPDGKLDWGVQGEELNKFRKSASFAFRGNQSAAPPPKAAALDEPDLSWVSSLVKDGPGAAGPVGRKQQQYQLNAAAEMFTPWEQLYGEQEQMVA